MLEIGHLFEDREEPEVHRPHVKRSDLGLKHRGRAQALFDAHRGSATRRDVDDDVRALLDHFQEGLVGLR